MSVLYCPDCETSWNTSREFCPDFGAELVDEPLLCDHCNGLLDADGYCPDCDSDVLE